MLSGESKSHGRLLPRRDLREAMSLSADTEGGESSKRDIFLNNKGIISHQKTFRRVFTSPRIRENGVTRVANPPGKKRLLAKCSENSRSCLNPPKLCEGG
jgi:hypothetical protein